MKINIKGPIVPNEHKQVYDFFGLDAVCPADITSALEKANGEFVEVHINSPGGDVWSGDEIYTALLSYPGDAEIRIVGLAGSAASVVAMARRCIISPVGQIMIHNVSSYASGDYRDMHKTGDVLDNASDALANAYMAKCGKSREEIRAMMDKETWLTAPQALEIGLVDGIMETSLVAGMVDGMLPDAVVKKTLAQLQAGKAAALETAKTAYENLMKKEF